MQSIFLNEVDLDGFYEGYSNSTLWPLLHYMVQRAKFENSWRETCRRVNRKFTEADSEIESIGSWPAKAMQRRATKPALRFRVAVAENVRQISFPNIAVPQIVCFVLFVKAP